MEKQANVENKPENTLLDQTENENKKQEKDWKQDKSESTSELQTLSINEQSNDINRMCRLSQIDLNVGFPGSYGTQLMRITAEAVQHEEDQEIKHSVETLKGRSNLQRKSLLLKSKAAKAEPLLPISNLVRSTLHELQLVCLAFQCFSVIALVTQLNWEAKLRGPIPQVPTYSANRMPTIPQQDAMHKRLQGFLAMLSFIYFPGCVFHFAYVLDDIPDETPLQLLRKVVYAHSQRVSTRKSRRWSLDPRFNQFRRPRRRQWATVILSIIALTLYVYAIAILCVDCNNLTSVPAWRRIVHNWIGRLQEQYYNPKGIINEVDPVSTLDMLHNLFRCCGRSGPKAYMDWWSSEIPKATDDWIPLSTSEVDPMPILNANATERLIPYSCCQYGFKQDCDHLHGSEPLQFFQRGCQEPIVDLLIRPWINKVRLCLILVLLLLIPQIVLYLSIIQPREAIRQFQRTIVELQLLFSFWREMNKNLQERKRKWSEAQAQQLEQKQDAESGEKKIPKHLDRPGEPGDIFDSSMTNRETHMEKPEQRNRQRGDSTQRTIVIVPNRQRPSRHTSLPSETTINSDQTTDNSDRVRRSSGITLSTIPETETANSDKTSISSGGNSDNPSESTTTTFSYIPKRPTSKPTHAKQK